MRDRTLFLSVFSAGGRLLALSLLAGIALVMFAPSADADGDLRLPGVAMDAAGTGCTLGEPQTTQFDYQLINITIDAGLTALDYTLRADGRPDIPARSGVVLDAVQESFLFEGGVLTAVLEVGGRVVATDTTDYQCPTEDGGEELWGAVAVRKECRESQQYYEISLRRESLPAGMEAEPVTVMFGPEQFVLTSDSDRRTIVRQQPSVEGDRIVATVADEVLLDVNDVVFECPQQASDIDIDVVVACPWPGATGDSGLIVVSSNNRKEYVTLFVEVDGDGVTTEIRDLEPGEQRRTVLPTAVPDGDAVVTVRIGAGPDVERVVIAEQVVTVDCVEEPVGTATIDSYCFDNNGVIVATVTGASEVGSSIVYSVTGLSDREVVVSAGETKRLLRTGRPDGPYSVVVSDGDIEIANQVIDIACDPLPPLSVELSVSCASPRIVAVVTNNTDASVEYSIDVVGVQAPPITGTLAPGESATKARTGRRDGVYTVRTSADGVVVSTEIIEVDCVAAEAPAADVSHYCFGGNGVIAATLLGAEPEGTAFTFAVSGLSDRVVEVGPGETQVTRRTGRPDGIYEVTVEGGGVIISTEVTIACD